MPPTVNMGIPGATSSAVEPVTGKRVLLAEPRGYCAGVDRAVETVERALEKHGPPVYVRHEIVHNRHVVDTLAKAGAIFVDETDEEHRTRFGQGVHHMSVVHDLMPDVHRRAVLFQRTLDRFDGAIDAGAVPAWLGEQYPLAGHRLDRRAGGAGDPHVDGWRHGNQVTFCGLGLASLALTVC